MKEKIIEILNNNFPDSEGWNTFDLAADKIVILINQEVERRIKERMPIRDCENCIYNEHHSPASAEAVINGGDDPYEYDYCAKDYWCGQPENDYPKRAYCEHFRSRLTKEGANSSQNTEQ